MKEKIQVLSCIVLWAFTSQRGQLFVDIHCRNPTPEGRCFMWRKFIRPFITHFTGLDILLRRGHSQRPYDMNGRFYMQGGKNWILPMEMNANRFFWDSHWLEIWSNHLFPSMGLNGGSVAMDSESCFSWVIKAGCCQRVLILTN